MSAIIDLANCKNILIIGMAGGLSRITATLLIKKYPHLKILGIDEREIKEKPSFQNISCIRLKYTRSQFEKLFRSHHFDVVLHLGRISHAKVIQNKKRLDLNVVGTGRILELCLKFKVKKAIVLSTYHVYGALPDNQAFITEDLPLRASINHPELRDVVEMDQVATNNMWKHQQKLTSIVLRPCSIIGPQIKNAMTSYLLSKFTPSPLDYNPKFQFIHEFDMASIIIGCIERAPIGIYNVAPDGVISFRDAKKIVTPNAPKIPIFVAEYLASLIGGRKYFKLPRYLIDYIKYPCLISNAELKKYLGPECFRYTSHETVDLLRLSAE